MYQGYVALGDVELMNSERTFAYARNAYPEFVRRRYEAPMLGQLLGHGDYASPMADGAPWYNPNNPDTADFYGWYPTAMIGFDDSTLESTVTELAVEGGVAADPRAASRQLLVRGLMIGKGSHALEAGMTWLRGVLATADCRQQIGCAGEAMRYFASTPEACEDSTGADEIGPDGVNECLAPYVREFHRTTVIQGLRVVGQFTEESCLSLLEVEVLFSAGVPFSYTLPHLVGSSQVEPLFEVTNLAVDPDSHTLERRTASPGSTLSVVEADGLSMTEILPAGGEVYSYAWSGTEGSSPSVEYIDGVAERTNLVPAPRDIDSWQGVRVTLASDPAMRRVTTAPDPFRATVSSTTGLAYMIQPSGGRTEVGASTQITVGMWVRSTVAQAYSIQIYEYDAAGALLVENATYDTTTPAANTWTYLNATFTTNAATASLRLGLSASAGPSTLGTQFWLSEPIIQTGATVGDYFDGTFPDEFVPGAPVTSGPVYMDYEVPIESMIPGQGYVAQATIDLEEAGPFGPPDARTLQALYRSGGSSQSVITSQPLPDLPGRYVLTLPFVWPVVATDLTLRVNASSYDFPTRVGNLLIMSAEEFALRADRVGGAEGAYFSGDTPDNINWDYSWQTSTVDEVEVPNAHFETSVIGLEKSTAVTAMYSYSGVTAFDGVAMARMDIAGATTATGQVWQDVPIPPGSEGRWIAAITPARRSSAVGLTHPRYAHTRISFFDDNGTPIGSTPAGVTQPLVTAFRTSYAQVREVPPLATVARVRLYPLGDQDATVAPADGTYMTDGWQVVLTDSEAQAEAFVNGTLEQTSTAGFNSAPAFSVPEVTCDPALETTLLRQNLAWTPGPDSNRGWVSIEDPDRYNTSRVSADSLAPGRQAVRSIRTSVDAGADAYILRLMAVGAPNSAYFPIPQPLTTYGVSIYLRSNRSNCLGVLVVRCYDSVGGQIGGSITIASDVAMPTAGTWYRLSGGFNAPAGTRSIDVRTSVRVASGTSATNNTAWASSVLVERGAATGPWFDGSTADTAQYDYRWDGDPFESPSSAYAQTYDPLRDPGCEFIPIPPQPPAIVDTCVETPEEWVRYWVAIPPQEISTGYAAVPRLAIFAGGQDARQIRLRVYPNNTGAPPQALDECSYIGDFIVTYLPANTTMIIDGRARTVEVDFGNSVRSALHLLRGSDGKPFTWPLLQCHSGYTLTADLVPGAPDTTVTLWLAERT